MGERRCSHSYHCSRDQVCVNGKCQKRECYYHNQCKQGHYCASGICKPKPGYCTSQSSCTASQCCAKYYPQHVGGLCKDRKKPGAWCPVKVLYICEGILHYFVCVLFVRLTRSIYRELLYFNHKPKTSFCRTYLLTTVKLRLTTTPIRPPRHYNQFLWFETIGQSSSYLKIPLI